MSTLAKNRRGKPAVRRVTDKRVVQLYESLRRDDEPTIGPARVLAALTDAGLRPEDSRIAESFRMLRAHRGQLDLTAFDAAVGGSVTLVERAITDTLAVSDFPAFRVKVEELFEASRANTDGEIASYIPQLARVDAESYAIGICTVDGQRLAFGDARKPFCVQSSFKPANYCLAVEDRGADFVHRHVGREPSGQSFNAFYLNSDGRPHNPMVNAGAIMSASLIGPGMEAADRFDHVTELWTRLMGGTRPGFANAVYLSERQTADRNFALAYSMREHGAFPAETDLEATLEFYFQCCSLETCADDFAVMAATLANGGVCPLTEERVLQPETVRNCLSLMQSCGMYEFSGEWAFTIGLPAKSGVSGVILVVIPGRLGYCIWSPRLDRVGNSARGVEFSREFAEHLHAHPLSTLGSGHTGNIDDAARAAAMLSEMLWAASKDDVHALRRAIARGSNLGAADYDGRTALHIAASEGSVGAARFLVAHGVPLGPKDRWGNTPRDDATREGHDAIGALLDERTPDSTTSRSAQPT